jgi:hypothetical protein
VNRAPSSSKPSKPRGPKSPAVRRASPAGREPVSRKKRLRPLEEVLAYENRDVVQRFLDMYPIDPADAEDIFTETKRWLWLLMLKADLRGSKQLVVTGDMFALDEMWHCFLVFTLDYSEFCRRFFGQFAHHLPVTLAAKARHMKRAEKDPAGVARAHVQRMERQYRCIAEHLGEETLRKWYVELPAKYPGEVLRRLHAQSTVTAMH